MVNPDGTTNAFESAAPRLSRRLALRLGLFTLGLGSLLSAGSRLSSPSSSSPPPAAPAAAHASVTPDPRVAATAINGALALVQADVDFDPCG